MEMSGQHLTPAASCPGKNPGTHWVWGWVGLRASLDVTKKLRDSNPIPYREWSGHYTDYVIPAPGVYVTFVCVCVYVFVDI